jgi:hypothetical protein
MRTAMFRPRVHSQNQICRRYFARRLLGGVRDLASHSCNEKRRTGKRRFEWCSLDIETFCMVQQTDLLCACADLAVEIMFDHVVEIMDLKAMAMAHA